ncbi:ABC transporter ATP-binding protein [Phyllobacterium zundukense]|uniref:Sn-glycerol-3-phosphate ABC transporter ATP-binding protein UgpC n=1 Tax=Phyllobacterium zundukense TaxID=1867719 RepID=A0ACD4CW06_9HYPH|nr:sn-glycerol-3-phosphate ABC transporter ATP-binding protein UgpC [Phyllobacterium zundukense]UXN57749.1 sn-glycerol-3-phosphate ABC transporter ATP-binding protein UgpC [Phyllobacterium zundukense]
MAEVRLESIRKVYGALEILKDVNLDIKHGEFVVFVGPSGSGKSTLLRMIGGLEKITGGKLLIDNKVVNQLDAADRNLGMVFQSYALYPHMTVRENLAFPLRMAKLGRAQIAQKVEDAATLLQINHLLDRKPKQLSGGQRQRVAIGRAIVREPQVFLFDEPLSNLDTELRVQMRVQIAKLHRQLGNTMIYVTHDQVEAMTMADKIVVLKNGNVEQVGTPHDLYHNPASQFVAGFIGSPRMNFLNGKLTDVARDSIRLKVGDRAPTFVPVRGETVRTGDEVTLGVRPDDFITPTGRPEELIIDVDLDYIEHLGATTYLYGTSSGEPITALAPVGDTRFEQGQQISLAVSTSDCHVFTKDGSALARLQAPTNWS